MPVRRRVADTMFTGSQADNSHAYFLAVLVYCFVTLRQLKPRERNRSSQGPVTAATTTTTAEEKQQSKKSNENRYAAFFLLEEGDDENDDEEDLPLPSSSGVPISKPVEPQGESTTSSVSSSCHTLAELLHGSDRDAAILFLMTLDEIMRYNADQFHELKCCWSSNQRKAVPPLTIISQILKASTVANFGIQYVQVLEQNLSIDFPHMDTIYRLLAVLRFPVLTKELTAEVIKLNSNFKSTDAKMFLGDCLEKVMRNETDPARRNIARQFSETWKIPMKRLEEHYINRIIATIRSELPIGRSRWTVALGRMFGVPIAKHSWLPLQYIGTSKRSILMTIKHLQGLISVIRDQRGYLDGRKSFFGKSWDETKTGLAESITEDMGELLTCDILPVLIDMSYGSPEEIFLQEEELLPLFTLLRNYANHPKKPVSWALAFGVHTLLTSIFEVQGGGDFHNMAQVAESSFNSYFAQISFATQEIREEVWMETVEQVNDLKMLFAPPTLQTTRDQILRACWNPLCAGTFLRYIALFSNLSEGTCDVNNMAQLRIVLHLCNALKDRGLIQVRSGGILELLDYTFQNSKAIWEGPKPSRGNFVVRWWIASGMSIHTAKDISRDVQARFGMAHRTRTTRRSQEYRQKPRQTRRRMTPIEPDKLSTSFRRIVNRDFSDIIDVYHHPDTQQVSSLVYDHVVRCNDTIDAIDEEQPFLALNMTAVGAYLSLFILRYFDTIHEEAIEGLAEVRCVQERMERTWVFDEDVWDQHGEIHSVMADILGEEILGRLDFLDVSSESDPVLLQASECMTDYFDRLDPERIMYFVPAYSASSDSDSS